MSNNMSTNRAKLKSVKELEMLEKQVFILIQFNSNMVEIKLHFCRGSWLTFWLTFYRPQLHSKHSCPVEKLINLMSFCCVFLQLPRLTLQPHVFFLYRTLCWIHWPHGWYLLSALMRLSDPKCPGQHGSWELQARKHCDFLRSGIVFGQSFPLYCRLLNEPFRTARFCNVTNSDPR